jgi:hypothetical protein
MKHEFSGIKFKPMFLNFWLKVDINIVSMNYVLQNILTV